MLLHLTGGYFNKERKKQKASSPEVFYDMDTGTIRTEQRLDPINDMILARLDKLSLELKSTLKSDDINALATKEDINRLTDKIDAQGSRITELETESKLHRTDITLLQSISTN